MDKEEKKPGLAIVIAKQKAGAEPDEDDEGKDDDGYAASVDELADVLGVSDEKREAFADAFKAACMSCK